MIAVEEKLDLATSSAHDLIADLLKRMPPDTTLRQFVDEILLMEGLREGLNDVRQGRIFTHEEVMKEFKQWIGT